MQKQRKERYLFSRFISSKVHAMAVIDRHKYKAWACEWLKRYDKEGIEGLKTRPKRDRPLELSEEITCPIKKE